MPKGIGMLDFERMRPSNLPDYNSKDGKTVYAIAIPKDGKLLIESMKLESNYLSLNPSLERVSSSTCVFHDVLIIFS